MPCHPDRTPTLPERYQYGDAARPPDVTYILTLEEDEHGTLFLQLPFPLVVAQRTGDDTI